MPIDPGPGLYSANQSGAQLLYDIDATRALYYSDCFGILRENEANCREIVKTVREIVENAVKDAGGP